MDVDYQDNVNLLRQAKESGVKKFVYVSVLNGEHLKYLKICEAKEMFVERLKESGLDYCIVRPNGFFSDMSEIFGMAEKGRVYLFGTGDVKVNPIHGADLAKICVDAAITGPVQEINVGGSQTLTHNKMAMIAFKVLGKEPKITYLPDWLRMFVLKVIRTATGSKVYGPIELFLTVMAMYMLAPEYGENTLEKYFIGLNDSPG